MGYNTTVVIMNDALRQIEKDAEFGKNLVETILRMHHNSRPKDVISGSHCNAATVIETHHADLMKLISVGGNCGTDLGYHGFYSSEPKDLLKSLADQLGYRVVKKRVKENK